jgi:hypothetical protein
MDTESLVALLGALSALVAAVGRACWLWRAASTRQLEE